MDYCTVTEWTIVQSLNGLLYSHWMDYCTVTEWSFDYIYKWNIRHWSKSGQETRIVQNGFSAGFDRVNHQGILYKLCSAVIGGFVLSILTPFLSNRSQHVMVDGCRSKLVKVVSGVPHGNVLGQLLFLLLHSPWMDYCTVPEWTIAQSLNGLLQSHGMDYCTVPEWTIAQSLNGLLHGPWMAYCTVLEWTIAQSLNGLLHSPWMDYCTVPEWTIAQSLLDYCTVPEWTIAQSLNGLLHAQPLNGLLYTHSGTNTSQTW